MPFSGRALIAFLSAFSVQPQRLGVEVRHAESRFFEDTFFR
jgi:hypothetical protein